jgi:hypothetical protein
MLVKKSEPVRTEFERRKVFDFHRMIDVDPHSTNVGRLATPDDTIKDDIDERVEFRIIILMPLQVPLQFIF